MHGSGWCSPVGSLCPWFSCSVFKVRPQTLADAGRGSVVRACLPAVGCVCVARVRPCLPAVSSVVGVFVLPLSSYQHVLHLSIGSAKYFFEVPGSVEFQGVQGFRRPVGTRSRCWFLFATWARVPVCVVGRAVLPACVGGGSSSRGPSLSPSGLRARRLPSPAIMLPKTFSFVNTFSENIFGVARVCVRVCTRVPV